MNDRLRGGRKRIPTRLHGVSPGEVSWQGLLSAHWRGHLPDRLLTELMSPCHEMRQDKSAYTPPRRTRSWNT
jgi:hypothetical protein